MSEKKVTIGRVVFVNTGGGVYRPGIVTKVWDQEPGGGCVNAHVFDDSCEGPLLTSLTHGTGEHEWLWPEELTPEQQLGQ